MTRKLMMNCETFLSFIQMQSDILSAFPAYKRLKVFHYSISIFVFTLKSHQIKRKSLFSKKKYMYPTCDGTKAISSNNFKPFLPTG